MKNSSPVHIVILIVAVLALAISLVFSWFLFMRVDELEQQIVQQNTVESQIDDLTSAAVTTTEQVEDPAMVNPVSSKSLNYPGGTFHLIHTCNGEVKEGEFRYCLGENVLLWQLQDGRVIEVVRETSSSMERAPVLKPLRFVENETLEDAGGVLLVAFTPAYLDGPDFKDQEATQAIFAQTEKVVALQHFPEYGRLVWNKTGEKAVVVPMLCGGAGCEEEPISGYSIVSDKVTASLTAERGVGIEGAQDVMGNALATWGEVTWTDEDTAQIVWQPPTGSSNTIEVSF